MKHRHWLLCAMAAPLLYAFVVIRVNMYLAALPTYGDTDIYAATYLAIALLAAWVVLEVAHQVRLGRSGVCDCGYALKGIKCPECGRDLGSGSSVQ